MMLMASAVSAAGAPGTSPAQERITINVKDKPLGEVLASIGRTTGYGFVLDDSWRGHPVTAHLEDTPLHAGLKRILSGLNHAIVYLPDGQIKILIIEGASTAPAPGGKGPGRPSIESPASGPPRVPIRPPSRRPAALLTAPAPGTSPESGGPDPDETGTDPGKRPEDDETQD